MTEKENDCYKQFLFKRVKVFFRVDEVRIFVYSGMLISYDDDNIVIDDRILGKSLISRREITQMKELR